MTAERDLVGGAREYNIATINRQLEVEIHNSYANYEAIMDRRWTDLADVPKVRGKPILCLGSGPSLDQALPWLRHWEGAVICSQSQATTCLHHGKVPTYVVAYDPAASIKHMLAPWPHGQPTLVVHPGVGADLLAEWWGPRILYRLSSPNVAYYDQEQAVGYSTVDPDGVRRPMIRGKVRVMGSSVACQATIAHYLGYRPIFLVGADFGYPGNVARFTRASWDWVDREWSLESPVRIEGDAVAENGCPTDRLQLHYKRALVMGWRLDRSPLVNCSPQGALGELVKIADIKRVIKSQGRGFHPATWKDLVHRADTYLASRGSYAIELGRRGGGPVIFTEAKDLAALERQLEALRKQGAVLDIAANLRRVRRAKEGR